MWWTMEFLVIPNCINIDYITVETLGNSQDFGDLTQATGHAPGAGCASSRTRGIFRVEQFCLVVQDKAPLTFVLLLHQQEDAADFGDLSAAEESEAGSVSNQHQRIVAGG